MFELAERGDFAGFEAAEKDAIADCSTYADESGDESEE